MKGIRRMDKKIEALVLTDGEGAYFAVPLDALEAYRVGDGNVDGFVAGLGVDDVQGFDAANTARRGALRGRGMASLGVFLVPVGNSVAATPSGDGPGPDFPWDRF